VVRAKLIVARMAADRTAATARDRAAEISRIATDLVKKKAIEKLISKIP
jgi:hypothetical protein